MLYEIDTINFTTSIFPPSLAEDRVDIRLTARSSEIEMFSRLFGDADASHHGVLYSGEILRRKRKVWL